MAVLAENAEVHMVYGSGFRVWGVRERCIVWPCSQRMQKRIGFSIQGVGFMGQGVGCTREVHGVAVLAEVARRAADARPPPRHQPGRQPRVEDAGRER